MSQAQPTREPSEVALLAGTAGRWHRWWQHAGAAGVFAVMIVWHFWPALPTLTTQVPTGGTFDVYNFTAAPLTVARGVLRTPWRFWRGDRPFPDDFATTLHQVDYPYAFTYYALYVTFRNPMLVFNLCAMLIYFANAWCMYALVRRWSGQWLAGIVAGTMCAFYAYTFFCMELDVLVMYIAALALLGWLAWLEHGGWARLLLFFGALALKTTTPDYQGVFLAVLFSMAVPLGFLAYPQRWRREYKRFLLASGVFVILMAPFIYPYVKVLTRHQGHGWRGIMFINYAYLTPEAWRGVWRGFWHAVTHLRAQGSPDPIYLPWPGVVWQVSAVSGLAWGMIAPLVYGRRALLRWALVLGAAVAFCLAFAPRIHVSGYGPLSRLYVDPPVLAVVRVPRAFVFSLNMCVAALAGLAVGDLLRVARTRRWAGWLAGAGVCLGVALYTLENTVALRPLSRYDVLRNLPPAYQWLRAQRYPSPFIEFPYQASTWELNVKGAMSALIDQPAAKARARYVHPLQYFLAEMNRLPLTSRAAFVSVSPYRYWLEEGAGETERRLVEAATDIRYATNLGSVMIFENPAPRKTWPVSVVVTQLYSASFPNVIYTLGVNFYVAAPFTYVPERERPFSVDVRVLDAREEELARLRVREELPFVMTGPVFENGLHVQYDRTRGQLIGRVQRPGAWRLAKAPVARARFSDEKMRAARWLDITVTRRGAGAPAARRVPLSPLAPRWPYPFGTPVSYPYQAGGLDTMQGGERPFQRSIGRQSVVCLPRPEGDAAALAFTLQSAVPFVKEGADVRITLNDTLLGTVRVSSGWETVTLAVPPGVWRDQNWLMFTYPKTYVPCVTQGGDDDKQRCVALAEIALAARAAAEPAAAAQSREAPWGANLLRNPAFTDGVREWLPWRDDDITNRVWFVTDAYGGAMRMANPRGTLAGVQQLVMLTSGSVYRLSARARSLGTDGTRLFGARVAVWLPPQPEPQLVWLYEQAGWRAQSIIFTNYINGVACVYVHLGYGHAASTGEFADVRLERLEAAP